MFSHDNQTIIHYYNTRFRRLFFLHEANLKAFLCFTYQRESRIKIEDTRHANDQYLFPQSTSFPLQAFSEGVDMALDLRTKHILSGCLFLSPPPPSGGGGGVGRRESPGNAVGVEICWEVEDEPHLLGKRKQLICWLLHGHDGPR